MQLYEFIMQLARDVLALGKDVLYWFNTPLDQYEFVEMGVFGDILEWLIHFLPDTTPFMLLLSIGLPLFVLMSVVNFFSRII